MNTKYSIINDAMIESMKISILISARDRILKDSNNKLYFNWGILWDYISPLLLVIGFAVLLSAGVRDVGFSLDIMIFLFLFWFGFTSIVTKISNLSIPKFQMAKKTLGPWIIIYGEGMILCAALFIRFIICLFFLKILDYNIELYNLTVTFICICLLGFSYGILFAAVFHNNDFISEFHNYFIQALFFTSSIIIPVTALPDVIRDILLFNPLVHLNEWLKTSYTGITYHYVDINYFLYFLIGLLVVSPIALYLKHNLINSDKAFKSN
jgi:capsular polysaccharide transport system permease protein